MRVAVFMHPFLVVPSERVVDELTLAHSAASYCAGWQRGFTKVLHLHEVRVSFNPGDPIPSSKQQMIVAGAPSSLPEDGRPP